MNPPRLRTFLVSFAILAAVPSFFTAPASAQQSDAQLQQDVLGAVPRLQVPIPGIQLTAPIKGNDNVTVPFLAQYISGLYTFLISVVGVLAGVMMMIGGFQYLTAGGDKGKVDAGKEKITNAITGLVLALGSYVILYTINPNLTEFQLLNIPTVAQDPLPSFAGKDDLGTDAGTAKPISDTTYDEIFKKYAPCAGVDWKVLKAMAYKESGLNTQKVNASNYVGLFQTKPENCASTLKGYTLASECGNLTNPDVNTAVAAMMLKSAVTRITRQCPQAPSFEQSVMFYVNHNMGGGVLKHALKSGCSLTQLRVGSIDYYSTTKDGQGTAKSYANQYQRGCLAEGKSEAECTGGKKFDYAKQTASTIFSLKVTELIVRGGTCQLERLGARNLK